MSVRLDFRVLGPVEVRVDGVAVPLGTPKRRKLLALLVLHPRRVVSWQEACEELWDDRPPRSAASNLRSYAANLRVALSPGGAPERLLTRPAGYTLRADDHEIDLGRFSALADEGAAALSRHDGYRAVRTLRQALDLWRGEPIEDVPAGPLLTPIVSAMRERRLGVMERYAAARLAIGESDQVIPELQELLARHPWRERGWALLICARYWTGDAAGALRAFSAARSALREHLGIEPGEEMTRLQHAILNRTMASPLDCAAHPSMCLAPDQSAAAQQAVPHRLPAAPPVLTGCASQLAAVVDALVRPGRARAARVVIIHGPPGTGKSALALMAAHHAAPRFPDGQLYADLARAPRADAGDVAAMLLDGTPVQNAARGDTTAGLRSYVAGRRFLLLVDNVSDSAMVSALLPAEPRCAVLVTSCQALGTIGAAVRVTLGKYDILESLPAPEPLTRRAR